MYDINKYKKLALGSLNDNMIPDIINEEWIKYALKNETFRRWGFCFSDLSKKRFAGEFSDEVIRQVNYSTFTRFPLNHPFKFNSEYYKTTPDVDIVHRSGLNGENINIAVIDNGFTNIPTEIEGKIKNYYESYGYRGDHFHGEIVLSYLVGKNIGVVQNANVSFYDVNPDYFENHPELVNGDPKALYGKLIYDRLLEIYNKNLNGENIQIVNISSGYAKSANMESEFAFIKDKLKETGCYVIDSDEFSKYFTSVNTDLNNNTYYFSDWQKDNIDFHSSKIMVPSSEMVPLWGSNNDYMYHGNTSFSWSIPKVTGMFALALQVNPKLTFDEFAFIARETSVNNVINASGIIDKVKLELDSVKEL